MCKYFIAIFIVVFLMKHSYDHDSAEKNGKYNLVKAKIKIFYQVAPYRFLNPKNIGILLYLFTDLKKENHHLLYHFRMEITS